MTTEIVSGDIGSVHIARREFIGDSGVLSDGYTVGSIGMDTYTPEEPGVKVVGLHRDEP